MDQARPRHQHRHRADALAADLGNEPPLSVDGGNGNVIDRRRVSVQWFSGTILTGVCGAALMGGAVFASLDGETNFATIPERVESALRGAIGGTPVSCISAQVQVLCHLGYEPTAKDAHDVLALCREFALAVPRAYESFARSDR